MSSPTFMHADPSALTIPNDSNGVIQALKEIKDLLVAMNNNLSVVIGQTAAHHADISTAATTLGNHDSGITNLESAMVKLMADIARISGAAVGSATAGSKAPKLALPDKFDGSDKNKAAQRWMSKSPLLSPCLDGKAHEWLEPYLEDDEVKGNPVSWLHDVAAFWVQFNACWNVQNRTENFRAKLCALKQTKGVQEYFKDFQVYSQGLGYNDVSLRDMFYDGLTIKIKEMLMAQDFDHSEASVTLQTLAEKALKIDQRLEQFAAQNKGTSSGQSGSKSNTLPSPAAPGSSREKLSVREKVYVIVDGKAKKGTLSSIGKNSKGVAVPTVKWDDGSFGESTFKSLKKDNHPITPTPAPAPKSSSSSSHNSGPAPMDLDSGTMQANAPQNLFSGHEANLSGDELEKEDL
ncbi:hypothetical protein OPQ81_012024 [Rhizoctonia solani]|nr:hypothetical protein OPQ81_012024 [Rhizoctonia solani]